MILFYPIKALQLLSWKIKKKDELIYFIECRSALNVAVQSIQALYAERKFDELNFKNY